MYCGLKKKSKKKNRITAVMSYDEQTKPEQTKFWRQEDGKQKKDKNRELI